MRALPIVVLPWIATCWWFGIYQSPRLRSAIDELQNLGPGVYQYVDGGTRYLPGEWPDTDPAVFDPEGAVFRYETPPPSETPPPYPSPAG